MLGLSTTRLAFFFTLTAIPATEGCDEGDTAVYGPPVSPTGDAGGVEHVDMIRDVTPLGSDYSYVANSFSLPEQRTDFAIDLNGDGKPDNQFGNVIGTLATQNLNSQSDEDAAIASGELIELFRLQTSDPTLKTDSSAGVTLSDGLSTAKPNFTGNGSYTVNAAVASSSFLGPLSAGNFISANPVTTTTQVTLMLPFVFSFTGVNTAPILLPINGARVSFTTGTDAKSNAPDLITGQINGSIKNADIQNTFIPAVAMQLTEEIKTDPSSSTSLEFEGIFDTGGCTNPDGTMAKAKDNIISTCEVANNGIIMAVLSPDVQIYDAAGNYAPNKSNTKPDSLSIGLGFTAVKASF